MATINYTSLLRKALKNAGFPQVKVLSLNVKGVERENQMKLEPGMVWRALFGLFYGDMLMLLLQQVRPYEKVSGTAQACWKHWVRVLSEDLRTGRNLTLRSLKRNFLRIDQVLLDVSQQKARKFDRITLFKNQRILKHPVGQFPDVLHLFQAAV